VVREKLKDSQLANGVSVSKRLLSGRGSIGCISLDRGAGCAGGGNGAASKKGDEGSDSELHFVGNVGFV